MNCQSGCPHTCLSKIHYQVMSATAVFLLCHRTYPNGRSGKTFYIFSSSAFGSEAEIELFKRAEPAVAACFKPFFFPKSSPYPRLQRHGAADHEVPVEEGLPASARTLLRRGQRGPGSLGLPNQLPVGTLHLPRDVAVRRPHGRERRVLVRWIHERHGGESKAPREGSTRAYM